MSGVHKCPAPPCGVDVPNSQFACRRHWAMLPADLKTPITRNYRRDMFAHLQAMGDARRWFRETFPTPTPKDGGSK